MIRLPPDRGRLWSWALDPSLFAILRKCKLGVKDSRTLAPQMGAVLHRESFCCLLQQTTIKTGGNRARKGTPPFSVWTGTTALRHVHPAPASSQPGGRSPAGLSLLARLNPIERWFAELTNKRIRRGSSFGVQELIAAIAEFLAAWNEHPQTVRLDGHGRVHRLPDGPLPPDARTDPAGMRAPENAHANVHLILMQDDTAAPALRRGMGAVYQR